MPRYFTVEQARNLLPATGQALREAVRAKGRYEAAESWLQNLAQRILMLGGVAVDTAAVEARRAQRDSSGQTLKSSLGRLEEMGVVVKDLDIGLVDFPTLFRGEEVYLCWRMDEPDIEHWHGLNEGFAGRKAIDRNFLENHRGAGLT